MKVTQATEHEFTSNHTCSETIVPSCRCPLCTAQSLRMYRVQIRPHLGRWVGSAAQHWKESLDLSVLSLPQFWWLVRTVMKLEEEGLENACGTWTMLAFYVSGAQNCIFGTKKSLAVWVVNFAFHWTAGTHGPRMVAGGHIACCFMLRLPVWYQSIQVVNVFLIEMCFGCNSNSAFGKGLDEVWWDSSTSANKIFKWAFFGHWCLLCLQGRVWRVFLFPSDERTAYKASQTFSLCFDSEVGSPIPLRCKRHLGSL